MNTHDDSDFEYMQDLADSLHDPGVLSPLSFDDNELCKAEVNTGIYCDYCNNLIFPRGSYRENRYQHDDGCIHGGNGRE